MNLLGGLDEYHHVGSRRSGATKNRLIETAQVIEQLMRLAKDMRDANARGEALGLSEEELAFCDALETNDGVVTVLGDETHLRVIVKRILRKYGHPPDKQEQTTQTAREQAEVLSAGWVARIDARLRPPNRH